VGSNAIHPVPSMKTSGHACRDLLSTAVDVPDPAREAYPTDTLVGIPRLRAMTAKVVAKCTQYPRRWSRKASMVA